MNAAGMDRKCLTYLCTTDVNPCHLQTINPDYKKPPDYNEPTIKITDKVMIPQVIKTQDRS